MHNALARIRNTGAGIRNMYTQQRGLQVQFNEILGPNSQAPHPRMDALAFDHFHEVWLVSWTLIGADHQHAMVCGFDSRWRPAWAAGRWCWLTSRSEVCEGQHPMLMLSR